MAWDQERRSLVRKAFYTLYALCCILEVEALTKATHISNSEENALKYQQLTENKNCRKLINEHGKETNLSRFSKVYEEEVNN